MKVFLLSLTIFMCMQTTFAQTNEKYLPVPDSEQPLRYFGHFEFNGLIPLRNTKPLCF